MREEVIASEGLRLKAMTSVPEGARGVVLFAHGSGSGRLSPRNRYVADVLVGSGIATVLLDLLTEEEEQVRSNVFDIDVLTWRLIVATHWIRRRPGFETMDVGYFGASTGAAAALQAAAREPNGVAAVVSRGGRPDLAAPWLARVRAPTLLLVGERDPVVLELNREAFHVLDCEKEFVIVPGATHLFEEPGALEHVAARAAEWFTAHFTDRQAARRNHDPSNRPLHP